MFLENVDKCDLALLDKIQDRKTYTNNYSGEITRKQEKTYSVGGSINYKLSQ